MNRVLIKTAVTLMALDVIFTMTSFAGQGAQRMLYTVPNSAFIESPSGDSVVTINDTSGSIVTLQTSINNARAANPNSIIAIHLLSGATYWVSSAGLVLGSQECLVGTGATIKATNMSVTVPLVTITNGASNVSVAGGNYDANGANIYGIFAPSSSARVNIDKATVMNCGLDCIQLNGNGGGYFDNEMTVTRCDLFGSPNHSGISIWNATQTVCVDNFCHSNSVGIWVGNGGFCNIANNVCVNNSTGINCNSGSDNYIINNTCANNGMGIYAGGSGNMIVSDLLASNSVTGISSGGSGNIFCDNLFTNGNAVNFVNAGSGDDVVAYKGSLSASGQGYFYPPLIDDQHNDTIVNGMGRYDLNDNSTGPIDNVQSEYNAAVSANPGDVIVLHLNGNYTVGANPLTLSSDTCILLGGTIQMNPSSASEAIYANGASYISISGGTVDGGTTSSTGAGHGAIYFTGCSMFQIDGMTLQNFGTSSTRVGGSDVVKVDHGSTPRIFTRNTIINGSARGFWLATAGVRDIVSDNTVSGVQMDGVDCDESTYASLVKFNNLHNNSRYGVFLEQSASDNCVIGNICNYNSSYDIGCYNNSSTPRGATAYNNIICNALLGDNGIRNGSTGNTNVTSSDNFFFDNTVMNANIQSQLYGSQNYYSQNYLGNSSLSTSGTEVFFNSPDVNGNLYVQDSHSGLEAVITNASAANGAAVILGPTNTLDSDQWSLIPTDSGYYRLLNKNSGLAMVVLGASLTNGAPIIQWTYNASGNDEWMPVPAGNGLYSFINRLSGLDLDVTGAGTTPGTPLDQQPSAGGANQQFDLIDAATPPTASTLSNSVSWTSGGAPDGNWGNAANWGGLLPQGGDWIAFGGGAQVLTTNDFTAGTFFGNITFTNGSPSFALNGNGIVFSGASVSASGSVSGGGITEASVNNQTVNLPITLAAGAHVISTAGGAGTLVMTNSVTRNHGAEVQFGVSGGTISSTLGLNNGIIGGWAVYSPSTSLINNAGGAGAVDWAVTNSSGTLTAYSGYTTVSGSGQTIANNPSSNVKIASNGSSGDTVGSGTTTINTLIWSATTQNGYINIPASSTLRLGAQGAILHNDNKYLRIGNGQSGSAVTAGGADNVAGELCVYNLSYYAADAVEFWTTLTDNGSGPVTMTAFGSVKIDNANTYSGGTYINAGDFYCNGGGNTPFGTGPVYVQSGGRADLGGDNNATVANAFNISGRGFLAGGNCGAIKGTYNGVLAGLITLSGDAQIDPNAGTWPNTCTFSGGFAGTGNLTIGGSSNVVAGVATFAGNCTFGGDAIVDATANAGGGSGILIASGKSDIMNNGGNLVLIGGASEQATFDLNGTTQVLNGLVNTNGAAANAIVKSSSGDGILVVGNSDASSSFDGVIQNGGGMLALTKIGAGILTLAGNNTFTGDTTVSNGTLALSGSGSISNTTTIIIAAGATLDASERLDQTLTLNNGQTLLGDGLVNVNLTVGTGATIMSGNSTSLGTLTVGSAAQLQGTTILKLNATTGTSDQINASSFIFGGALIVTNLSGAFTAYQSFPLFLGDAYSGSFNAITLPSLGSGLAWDTNSLMTNGVLQVVATTIPQPHITGIKLSGTSLIMQGTNGVNGETYVLLNSTNLTLPLNQWTPLLTNKFNSGSFSVTNTVNPNIPQNYYMFRLPQNP